MRVDLVIPANDKYDEDILYTYDRGILRGFLSFDAEDTNCHYKERYYSCREATRWNEPRGFSRHHP